MRSQELEIDRYMAKDPKWVCADTSLSDALVLMHDSKSHFLPVVSGNIVIGILRENAARMGASLIGSETFTASDWMAPRPTIVLPDASLYEVLDETPDNVYGCTVIQNQKGKIVGMFTPREALMAVRDLARKKRRTGRSHHV